MAEIKWSLPMHVTYDCNGIATLSRGYDSVIRRMKSLVCVVIDSVCVFSTFALELEDKQGRER